MSAIVNLPGSLINFSSSGDCGCCKDDVVNNNFCLPFTSTDVIRFQTKYDSTSNIEASSLRIGLYCNGVLVGDFVSPQSISNLGYLISDIDDDSNAIYLAEDGEAPNFDFYLTTDADETDPVVVTSDGVMFWEFDFSKVAGLDTSTCSCFELCISSSQSYKETPSFAVPIDGSTYASGAIAAHGGNLYQFMVDSDPINHPTLTYIRVFKYNKVSWVELPGYSYDYNSSIYNADIFLTSAETFGDTIILPTKTKTNLVAPLIYDINSGTFSIGAVTSSGHSGSDYYKIMNIGGSAWIVGKDTANFLYQYYPPDDQWFYYDACPFTPGGVSNIGTNIYCFGGYAYAKFDTLAEEWTNLGNVGGTTSYYITFKSMVSDPQRNVIGFSYNGDRIIEYSEEVDNWIETQAYPCGHFYNQWAGTYFDGSYCFMRAQGARVDDIYTYTTDATCGTCLTLITDTCDTKVLKYRHFQNAYDFDWETNKNWYNQTRLPILFLEDDYPANESIVNEPTGSVYRPYSYLNHKTSFGTIHMDENTVEGLFVASKHSDVYLDEHSYTLDNLQRSKSKIKYDRLRMVTGTANDNEYNMNAGI